MRRVPVPIWNLNQRQLLIAILYETHTLRGMMADLTQAVQNLQVAVQGVVNRVGPTVDQLKQQVAEGLQALEDFQAADASEDAAYQQAISELQDALQAQVDGAQQAADAIEGQVATLNTIATTEPEGPTGPVGPTGSTGSAGPTSPTEPPVE
jgi:hypothetical protein